MSALQSVDGHRAPALKFNLVCVTAVPSVTRPRPVLYSPSLPFSTAHNNTMATTQVSIVPTTSPSMPWRVF